MHKSYDISYPLWQGLWVEGCRVNIHGNVFNDDVIWMNIFHRSQSLFLLSSLATFRSFYSSDTNSPFISDYISPSDRLTAKLLSSRSIVSINRDQCEKIWQILPLWRNLRCLWQFFEGFRCFGQTFQPNLAKIMLLGKHFSSLRMSKIENKR